MTHGCSQRVFTTGVRNGCLQRVANGWQRVSTNGCQRMSINGCPQQVSPTGVHNGCPQQVSPPGVHNKCPHGGCQKPSQPVQVKQSSLGGNQETRRTGNQMPFADPPPLLPNWGSQPPPIDTAPSFRGITSMEPQTLPHLSEALHPRRSRNHRIGGASPGLPWPPFLLNFNLILPIIN
jgi:hypothetical protein